MWASHRRVWRGPGTGRRSARPAAGVHRRRLDDLFVEEDIEYARRLNEAGVAVELHVYPGCVHAFDVLPTESAARFKAALLKALGDAFTRSR
ncbi:MAG TPA: alpha/beta hydrolase fold domain-containing protein [Rhizomicrobium sp.]